MAKTEAVVFEFPNPNGGDPILKSNDPYWNAEQLLNSRKSGPGDDEDFDGEGEFDIDTANGSELKAKAQELGVDIKGLKKVGEVRQALRDYVAAQAEGDGAGDSQE